jgi:hypothetical protein
MKCEYCNKKLSSKYTLKKHQETAKYCLKIQNKDRKINFECEYCDKSFSQKVQLQKHSLSCRSNPNNNISTLRSKLEEKDNTIQNLKSEHKNEIDSIERKYAVRIKELETELKCIQQYSEILIKKVEEHKDEIIQKVESCVTTSASNNTNSNNNNSNNNTINIINNLAEIPSKEDIVKTIKQFFNEEHLSRGVVGFADFLCNHVFTNESGEKTLYYHNRKNAVIGSLANGDRFEDNSCRKIIKLTVPSAIVESKKIISRYDETEPEKAFDLYDKTTAISSLKDGKGVRRFSNRFKIAFSEGDLSEGKDGEVEVIEIKEEKEGESEIHLVYKSVPDIISEIAAMRDEELARLRKKYTDPESDAYIDRKRDIINKYNSLKRDEMERYGHV